MYNIPKGGGPFFDRGINGITTSAHEDFDVLPDTHGLLPSEQVNAPQIERLLGAPDFDALLESTARPSVDDRELLIPHVYARTLRGAEASLREALARERDPTSPRAERLQRALALLAQEGDLRELLRVYVSALYQA